MANLNKKVQSLIESTNSLEVKNICLNYLFTAKDNANEATKNLHESLIKLENKEAIVTELLKESVLFQTPAKQENTMDKNGKRFGIYESLMKIKGTKIYEHPQVKYTVKKFEAALESATPEFLLVRDFLSSMNAFTWDATISEAYQTVKNESDSRSLELDVRSTANRIKANDSNRFYDVITNKIDSWLTNESRNNYDLVVALKPWIGHYEVKNLVNRIQLMENENKGLNIAFSSNNCEIKSIVSPVLVEGASTTYQINGTYFKETKDSLEIVEASTIKDSFKALCEAFTRPEVKTDGDNVIFKLSKDHKVKMVIEGESKKLFLNEKEMKIEDIAKLGLLTNSNMLFNVTNTNEQIKAIKTIFEGLETLCDIDHAKVLESRVYENVKSIIFKKDNVLYVNKYNKTMNENSLSKVNGTQAVAMIKDFMKYDVSESLTSFLVGESKVKAKMLAERATTLDKIAIVEKQLNKIDSAVAEDQTLNESAEVNAIRDILNKEFGELKSRWNQIEAKITKFESGNLDELEEEDELADDTDVIAELPVETKEEPVLEFCEVCGKTPCECGPNDVKVGEEEPIETGCKCEGQCGCTKTGEEAVEDMKASEAKVNEGELEPGTAVKVKSTGVEGKVTSVAGDVVMVAVDGGENIEVSIADIESLEQKLIDAEDANAQAAEEKKTEVKENEATDAIADQVEKEEEKTAPAENYVKASLTMDMGPYKAGDLVEVEAVAYTSCGEEEGVPVKNPKEELTTIPKKFLKIEESVQESEEKEEEKAPTEIETVHQIISKLESALKNLSEAETIAQASNIINSQTIQDNITSLKAFKKSLEDEREILSRGE